MAKGVKFDATSFNFGANAKPKKKAKGKKGRAKSNAWQAYVGGGKKR
jgi:hypothetical protein